MDLPTDLSDAERRVVEHAVRGEICELGTGEPSEGAQWGEERVVRASVIYALCCGAHGGSVVHAKGVRIRGARIEGMLDFEDAVLQAPLHLLRCFIGEPMCFERARLPAIFLTGSYTHGIRADGLYAKEVALNNGFCAKGEVRLRNATIGISLECIGGTFDNPEGYALSADGLECKGSVFLRDGFSAKGEVRLPVATIGGTLDCTGGTFETPEGDALFADGLECKGDVFLRDGFSAKGVIRLVGATIGGTLECTDGTFENPEGDALFADSLDCKRDVFLRDGFSAKGKVRLFGATIGGTLDCTGGTFENPEGDALFADSLDCKRGVYLRDRFSAKGEVRLPGATIGGNLDCSNGTFENPEGVALFAYSIDCKRNVILQDDFSANGAVGLAGATIGGDLDCTGGTFDNPEGGALIADRLDCKGYVSLSAGFSVKGEVWLHGATIGGNLVCRGSIFDGSLRLTGARVATLWDDRKSWPASGWLFANGLHYDRIEPADVKTRLEWLERMPPTPFSPQPYTQLAAMLRSHGSEGAARKILMAREKARARRGPDPWWLKGWMRLLGVTIGYGYRPGRAVWGLVLVWLLGWNVFSYADARCQIVATSSSVPLVETKADDDSAVAPDTQPLTFHPSLYSLDVLVPVVNLQVEEDWIVLGGWVWWFMRAQIALGWVFSTLAVLGFSGLVRKD